MKQAARIEMSIPVSIFQEGKAFIAYSPVLDLATSGKTFAIVKERFSEAAEVFFEELLSLGTIDEVLSGLGWTKQDRSWRPPIPVSHEMTTVTIPAVH